MHLFFSSKLKLLEVSLTYPEFDVVVKLDIVYENMSLDIIIIIVLFPDSCVWF